MPWLRQTNTKRSSKFLDFSDQEFRKRLAWELGYLREAASGTWSEYSYAKLPVQQATGGVDGSCSASQGLVHYREECTVWLEGGGKKRRERWAFLCAAALGLIRYADCEDTWPVFDQHLFVAGKAWESISVVCFNMKRNRYNFSMTQPFYHRTFYKVSVNPLCNMQLFLVFFSN